MINVGIVGGAGYTGVELLRILCDHSDANVTAVTSRTEAGRPVAEVFPSLRGHCALSFTDPNALAPGACDVVFFATPNGVAMTQAPARLEAGVKVIDLSADFRLKDAGEWRQWYGREHACPQLLTRAVYGLPEINRDEIRAAELVANPGCYPTAVLLGFLPLLEQNLARPTGLVADCKSGLSGAGREAKLERLFCEAGDNIAAYAAGGHRHLPEITQGLTELTDEIIDVTFVPHLTPMSRGIHATLYAELNSEDIDLQQLYEHRYADEPFVDVLPAGAHPHTRSVRAANTCQIAVHRPPGGRVVVLSALDNLVKGAAGQAVQNMNLMFGLDEATGLSRPAVSP